MPQPEAPAREHYPHSLAIPTRWMDNDIYGHVNNVVYYSYFDTVVNEYLIRRGALDPHNGTVIGLVVDTRCRYYRPLSFPQRVDAGLAVSHIGNTSVHYDIALFAEQDNQAAARGHFVHVYVDRDSRRPVTLPQSLRSTLSNLVTSETTIAREK